MGDIEVSYLYLYLVVSYIPIQYPLDDDVPSGIQYAGRVLSSRILGCGFQHGSCVLLPLYSCLQFMTRDAGPLTSTQSSSDSETVIDSASTSLKDLGEAGGIGDLSSGI
jgi:hypothetical protein